LEVSHLVVPKYKDLLKIMKGKKLKEAGGMGWGKGDLAYNRKKVETIIC
jgi:hypothetical protein